MAMLLAAAKPELVGFSIRITLGNESRTIVVEASELWLSTTMISWLMLFAVCWIDSRQRRSTRSPFQLTMTMESVGELLGFADE